MRTTKPQILDNQIPTCNRLISLVQIAQKTQLEVVNFRFHVCTSIKPRLLALDHQQFGLQTNFPNTERLGLITVSRFTNTQAVNIVERSVKFVQNGVRYEVTLR